MKTPEELAEEYADLWPDMCINGARKGFLAGYRAATPKWIPVEESLPEPEQLVLMLLNYELNGQRITNLEFGYNDNNTWRGCMSVYTPDLVTYWMPLPKPPEEV